MISGMRSGPVAAISSRRLRQSRCIPQILTKRAAEQQRRPSAAIARPPAAVSSSGINAYKPLFAFSASCGDDYAETRQRQLNAPLANL